MADYLCRIRIDRASLDENKIINESEPVETSRYYLKLSDEAKEEFVFLQNFLDYIESGASLDAIKVQALLDSMKAANTLDDTEVIDTDDLSSLGYKCPLCTDIRENKLGESPIYLTDKKDIVEQKNSKFLLYVHDHIKVCSKCQNYYCDGGQEVDNTNDSGVTVYPETYKAHQEKFGCLPEETEGIREHRVPNIGELIEKPLIQKFNLYCTCLNRDDNQDQFDNYYLKRYPASTTYLGFKYDIDSAKEKFSLRMKIEISPCEKFLNRTYMTIDTLDEEVSKYLSHTVIKEPVNPNVPSYEQEVVNGELIIESARIEGDELFADNLDLEF